MSAPDSTRPAPSCRVCGRHIAELWTSAVDVEYGTTADRFDYYRCPDCDCLSIHPLPADRLGEIYPSTYYSFASGSEALAPERNIVTRVKARLDERTFRRALREVAAEEVRILDVGGGTGDIAAGLVRATHGRAQATVVDFDVDSIEVARRRGLVGYVGRFEDFDTDERYHLILMLNLIEHVAEPVALLQKARTLLAPGGLIWLQTPNYRSLDATLFRRRNWAGLHCPRHWAVFSAGGLDRTLRSCELDIVRFERTQAGAFWAASTLGLMRRRGSIGGEQLPKPLVRSPAFMPLAACGAAFDFATRSFRSTSQVTVFARSAG